MDWPVFFYKIICILAAIFYFNEFILNDTDMFNSIISQTVLLNTLNALWVLDNAPIHVCIIDILSWYKMLSKLNKGI